MAELARLRESPHYVIGVFSAREVVLVTSYASRTRQVVVVLQVAICALPRGNGVLSRQSKAGHAVVFVRLKFLLFWQSVHILGGSACPPFSGKPTVL